LKQITVDPTVCTGCRACELACSFAHTDMFSPELSRIRVAKFEDKGLDHPMVCQQCERAPCVKVCPVGALSRAADGHVAVDRELCIGCKLCSEVCPHGAISYEPTSGVALICDLCGGSPACVERCVTNALRFEEADKQLARRRQKLAAKKLGKEAAV